MVSYIDKTKKNFKNKSIINISLLLLFFLLVIGGDNPFFSPIIVFILLFLLCYVPAKFLFSEASHIPSIAEIVVYTLVGLIGLSIIFLITEKIRLPPFLSFMPSTILSSYAILKKRIKLGPYININKLNYDLIISSVLILVWFFPFLYQSVLMGRGSFPEVFYNVDSAFYLSLAHSLVNNDFYPAPFLSFSNETIVNHDGSLGIVALIAKISNIHVHSSMFSIVFPLLFIGIIAILYLIYKELSRKIPFWIFLLINLFIYKIPLITIYLSFYNNLDYFYYHFLKLDKNGYFNSGFPMLSTQFAILIVYIVIWCILKYDKSRLRLLAFLTGSLFLMKSPWFIGLGSGLGAYSILLFILKKEKKIMIYSSIGLFSAIFYMFILGSPSISTFRFQLWYYFLYEFSLPKNLIELHPFLKNINPLFSGFFLFFVEYNLYFIGLIVVLIVGIKRKLKNNLIFLWLFILMPLLFVNILVYVDTRPGYEGRLVYNIFQVANISPIFFSLLLYGYYEKYWPDIKFRFRRNIIVVAILILSTLSFTYHLYSVRGILKNRARGYEYVDNKIIAEALEVIPINNTIIVTNDFKYPANDGIRDLMQMQLPAIYGHQFYACNFVYSRFISSDERLDEQLLFQEPFWDEKLNGLAEKNGWTHLLIKKSTPYPDNIPIKILFTNKEYSVYEF